jgi:hypothetical protein
MTISPPGSAVYVLRGDGYSQRMIEDLEGIADTMAALLPMFKESSVFGLVLGTDRAATFQRLYLEARSLLDEELGKSNRYSKYLAGTVFSGSGDGGPSYQSVEEAAQIIRAAIREIERKRARPPASPPGAKPYVDPYRIAALQALGQGRWDFARLVELCREINVAAAHRCHMSTAMLLRAILDHVPPIFGFPTFAEVANNYGGPKDQRSFKGTMQRLQGALRHIADMHLHSSIREREDVPTAVQVDFAAELDVLLGEIIRVSQVEARLGDQPGDRP